MESTPVNWDALDSLVLDFAQSERLLRSSASPPPSPSSSSSASASASSSYHTRLLIRRIRRSLELGEIDATHSLLQDSAPAVAADHRILFRLHKQKFIELLRRGTEEDRDAAIECLRTSLAPCALDAYPEAYEEFKHVLLALVYHKDDQGSPVATEWSEKRRNDLAGLLSSILRSYLNAYDPLFSMTLRYLISIHKLYCSRLGISSPISDLTQRLLFEDKDPPATSQETLLEAPPFDEVDIQALAHAVELTRQGAVDGLRFAKGDLFQAFQNELCRVRLDVPLLDELVHEYCIYRGIVDGVPASSTGAVHSSLRDCSSLNRKCSSRVSDGENSVNNVESEGAQEVSSDAMSTRSDTEMRSTDEVTGNREDCSTSDTNNPETFHRRLRRSRNYASGKKRRKRWRGRDKSLDPDAPFKEINGHDFICTTVDASGGTLNDEQVTKGHSLSEDANDMEGHKYDVILEMMDLANKGMAAEVVDEVNAMDPEFFMQHPVLLFQLKQIEFLKLVSCGDHTMALRVACTHLGPLASSNQALLKPLKETLLALLNPSEDATMTRIPLSVLATSLQVAMSTRLGFEEPQLMKIMRATLHTHTEWYKLQMCKDRFEEFLKIDHLKAIDVPIQSDITSKASADNVTHGSSQITSSSSKMSEDGCSPAQATSGENVCDENAILKVMEFLALPRADAIHLLSQYNGNAESVIQQIFA